MKIASKQNSNQIFINWFKLVHSKTKFIFIKFNQDFNQFQYQKYQFFEFFTNDLMK